MKFLLLSLVTFLPFFANAADSGLKCSMSYSSTDLLDTSTDSKGGWLVAGDEMAGSAVGVGTDGLWSQNPANYISVNQSESFWEVTILDQDKQVEGSFRFKKMQGMKATVKTKAFMANEDEDPPQYNKLEVTCQFSIFAG